MSSPAILPEPWVRVKLSKIGPQITRTALNSAINYAQRNGALGAEYGNPLVGELTPLPNRLSQRAVQIELTNVCCCLRDFSIHKEKDGTEYMVGMAQPTGPFKDIVRKALLSAGERLLFTVRGIVENNVVTHVITWDFTVPGVA